MIAFLADASAKIGTGHMLRCLSVASQVRQLSEERISFICGSGFGLAEQAGFNVIERLSSPEYIDAGEVLELVKDNGIKCLITDSYIPEAEYFNEIDKALRSIRIFDIGDPDYRCDTVIDYNFDSGNYGFKNARRKLLGLKYAPLRSEFADLPEKYIGDEVKKILITAGGSDPPNATIRILKELLKNREFDDMKITVVSGALNPNLRDILRISKQFGERADVKSGANNMAELIWGSDVVLTAGGSTLLEVCACGAPAVAFGVADNQTPMIEAARLAGLILSGGSLIREDSDAGKICECLLKLKFDKSLRQRQSEAMRSAVDGLGARRIAECILDN